MYDINMSNFKSDCTKCFGLCCTALYFSKGDGFPVNKDAGKPCINLQEDFRCKVHKDLKKKGLKGCIAYDCLGAGQKVSEVIYGMKSWRENKETESQMFEVFIIVRQLQEMLWYLTEAFMLQLKEDIKEKIASKIKEIEGLTHLKAEHIIGLDLVAIRPSVNSLLLKTSEAVRKKVNSNKRTTLKCKKVFGGGLNLMGADLRKVDLKGENLSGAFLIASNLRGADLSFVDFIGADLRDADLSGANLSRSIYLTQAQINTAKGDSNTKLPELLVRPIHWDK